MTYQSIDVRKLTPVIGAEVFGVDLGGQISNHQFEEVHQALLDNLVIFFRDQTMTIDQHKAFAARFGRLHVHPNAPKAIEGHPEILVIKADENSKRVAGESWHSDVSCDEEPPMGSILHIHEVPENGGGDTMFANMYAAYDALSEPMKKFLSGLTATHDSGKAHTYRTRAKDRDDMTFPAAEHPVIRTHPETGRKALFVNRGFTTNIVQLGRSESDALLAMLFRHVETPSFSCRFKWRANSVAFWDNRAAQHQALWDYYPQRRFGYRVTVCGDKPFYRA
ncbi:MAG: TauD/TfdA dioxygenase family protein [Rhodopila sp.]